MLWADNVRTTLDTAISSGTAMAGSGTIVVDAASGAYNDPPDPDGETARIIIVDDLSTPTKFEIFYYTGVTDNGATLTLTGVTRAQEGTTAQSFAEDAAVLQDLTAQALSDLAHGWIRAAGVSAVEVL